MGRGVYEGKVYGIPFDPNVQILYYRQDLLDAQEIEVPTTWTGIYDAAMAAQDRDNELWGMAIMTKRDPQTGINLWTFINAWGNELFDENYQAAFVNDQGYAAAEFFKQVADNIAPSGHAGHDYAGSPTRLPRASRSSCTTGRRTPSTSPRARTPSSPTRWLRPGAR